MLKLCKNDKMYEKKRQKNKKIIVKMATPQRESTKIGIYM